MVQNEYKCKACGATFDSEQELDRHNHTMHSQHTCDECGRRFNSEHELETHYRIAHPEETPVR